jgi:hypothetical protein
MTFGAFGLSTQTIALFAWIFMKLNNGIIYGDGLLNAVAMGMMISMGSALSAALGAALVSSSLDSPKPVRWAFIVAFLYVLLETKRLIFSLPLVSRKMVRVAERRNKRLASTSVHNSCGRSSTFVAEARTFPPPGRLD